MSQATRKLALFDFDGTITRKDSFLGFTIFCRGKLATLRAIARNIIPLMAWKLQVKDNSYAKQRLFSTLFRGMSIVSFHAYGERYANEKIDHMLRHSTMKRLREHQSAGHTVAIISASMPQWIAPWANRHGITIVAGTEPEVDGEGRLTGRFATPNCHGPEKVNRIGKLFPDIQSFEIWAYGDSAGDRDMLALADHPFLIK